MFSKVLIANRGEIAVRVLQTCSEMGIRTVAVHSDADATALHVQRADECYRIGPAAAAKSYLNAAAILEVAARCGADAIHPGYGFLAEDAGFAEACRAAGRVFVGPPPEAMRLLGNKRSAKALARRIGMPLVPGYDGENQGATGMALEADRIGFPLLVKAAAGGGGRGMRIVRSQSELTEALDAARREALAAFSDGSLLLERYVEAARHVEIQVLADAHGNAVHLGERECSIQRRYQKIIEECPSTVLTPALRERLGQAALTLIRAAGYYNAGTVEFLLTGEGTFYFLEVNTRLQVEHPVTELVTGVDLVREQLRIAADQALSFRQENVSWRGHAIECRVCAEDPDEQFLPSTGPLLLFAPPALVGVRNDAGVQTGDLVSPYYDSLLAKVIIHAPNRASCVARARGALSAYAVLGPSTNLGLLRSILDSPAFRSGDLDTGLVGRLWLERPRGENDGESGRSALPSEVMVAAAGWAISHEEGGQPGLVGRALAASPTSPWRTSGSWRVEGSFRLEYRHGDVQYTVSARRDADRSWVVSTASGERAVTFARVGPDTLLIREGARLWTARVVETAPALHIVVDGLAYRLDRLRGLSVDEIGSASALGERQNRQLARLPGMVVKVNVRIGQRVAAGETLLVLDSMKTEHLVTAPRDATVKQLPFPVGATVPAGAVLVELEE